MNSTPNKMRKILVATDFSEHSKVALARAAEFAQAFQSQLSVAHCLPDMTFVPSASSVMSVSDDWTQKPKRILTGTDFSDGSRAAVLDGIALAEKFGAELHLMHVIDTTDTPSPNVARISGNESMRQSINDFARSRLENFVQSLECAQAQVQLHLNWGTPWRDMCQFATSLKVDLIVVGNVGRRGIQGLFLGNTADRILSHSKSSVLAVKTSRAAA